MAVAESLGADPVSAVVQELQKALCVRAQPLVWRTTDQGLVATIAEGELILAPLPGVSAWQLSVVFHAAPNPDDPGAAPVERGRRILDWGSPAQMQQRALELAMGCVPGGPAYLGGPLVWHEIEHDGSLRMAVSSGELRISPLEGELCTLSHEDGSAVEFLSLGTREELQRRASPLCLMRAGRPLQIRAKGRLVNLRSIGVRGVLGYHALLDRSLVVLALVHGDILLLQVRGPFHRILARLSWTDLMFGEPMEVQSSRGWENQSAPRFSRTGRRAVYADDGDPRLEPKLGDMPADRARVGGGDRAANSRPLAEVAGPGPVTKGVAHQALAADLPERIAPAAHIPMSDRHRELCRRYFRRLHRRLHGRGARKARRLVLLILEVLESCREDITGSRLEVHARLEKLLAQNLPGGPRNIRDCLDLLMCSSPFARPEPGKGCTLLFGQLHDPDSELMRFIADDDAREEQAANSPVAPESSDAPYATEARPEDTLAQQEPAVLDAGPPDEPTPKPEPSPMILPVPGTVLEPGLSVPTSVSWEHATVEVFRQLGLPLPAAFSNLAQSSTISQTPRHPAAEVQPVPPVSPGVSNSRSTGLSRAALRSFTSAKTWFLGELVDDDDETDAPSQYQGRTFHEDPSDSTMSVRSEPPVKKR